MDQLPNVTSINVSADSAVYGLDWGDLAILGSAGACCVLTVVGNLLVLLSFWVEKKLRTVSNYYIISLAVADLGVGLFSMNMYLIRLGMDKASGGVGVLVWPLICYSYLTFDHLLTHVSIITIIAIGIDRFLSIEDPMRYRAKRTGGHVKRVICLVWLSCFLLWFVLVFLWPLLAYRTLQPKEDCSPYYEVSPHGSIIAAMIYFWLPAPVLTVIYIKLYATSAKIKQGMKANGIDMEPCKPRRKRRASNHQSSEGNQQVNLLTTALVFTNPAAERQDPPGLLTPTCPLPQPGEMASLAPGGTGGAGSNVALLRARKISSMFESVASMAEAQNKKAFKAFSFILGALVLTWTPWATLVIVRATLDTQPGLLEATEALYDFSYFFTYINSTLNAMCYALASKTFANAFRNILCCRVRKHKASNLDVSSF